MGRNKKISTRREPMSIPIVLVSVFAHILGQKTRTARAFFPSCFSMIVFIIVLLLLLYFGNFFRILFRENFFLLFFISKNISVERQYKLGLAWFLDFVEVNFSR